MVVTDSGSATPSRMGLAMRVATFSRLMSVSTLLCLFIGIREALFNFVTFGPGLTKMSRCEKTATPQS
jgi:hypothetical protein